MAEAYSLDLRRRALAAWQRGEGTQAQVAARPDATSEEHRAGGLAAGFALGHPTVHRALFALGLTRKKRRSTTPGSRPGVARVCAATLL